ncbi:MAG TPA: 2OG-Fe dioxygenase family protein [Xanthomonadaceae bacterium]|nr:2OG-Fe dioxygenase family protein [Xanthomonadaceae bacterium]
MPHSPAAAAMVASFQAPYTAPGALDADLESRGYAVVAPTDVMALSGDAQSALDALKPSWDDLRPDTYLKDGGRYRKRRHSCFVLQDGALAQAPHRAHWQSLDYNALHGGMRRWFDPVDPAVVAQPAWTHLLASIGTICSRRMPVARWYIEAHQFRIDTSDGIGRPTPEGAHRDGVDFVAVVLVDRQGIKGGETRVFEAQGPAGQRFTLFEPWSMLLLDDVRMIHETTPIQPLSGYGHRDTLVLTYRAAGFQGDD